MYDLIIIGSGPAGLSAAVYAMRAKLDTLVIEKEAFSGGQIVKAHRVDNYLGLYGKSGYELVNEFKNHAEALGACFVWGNVAAVSENGAYRTVQLTDGTEYETKAVLVASGARYKALGAEGEKEHIGMGVSYCATCDGAFFKNKTVAVIGGGDVAISDVNYLAKICDKVYLIHRNDVLRASKEGQERMNALDNVCFMPFCEVKRINGSMMVESIEVYNNKTNTVNVLEVSGVFIAVGMEPETEAVSGLVEIDEKGYIIADESGITSNPAIFAAGDVRTKQLRQVITAVSDGANAVKSIENYLKKI